MYLHTELHFEPGVRTGVHVFVMKARVTAGPRCFVRAVSCLQIVCKFFVCLFEKHPAALSLFAFAFVC